MNHIKKEKNKKKEARKFERLKNRFIFNDYVLLGDLESGWRLLAINAGVDDEPILSSDTSSLEDLYKFGKDTIELDLGVVISKVNLGIAIFLLVIMILNACIFKNSTLRCGLLGMELMIMITSLVINLVG